ncbi:MAG: hypothetical protein J2P47_10165 [Acetobacteraceae bacterium]|nr:hypothetical protein [Acetobacteraceae bacterium]
MRITIFGLTVSCTRANSHAAGYGDVCTPHGYREAVGLPGPTPPLVEPRPACVPGLAR